MADRDESVKEMSLEVGEDLSFPKPKKKPKSIHLLLKAKQV